MTGDLVPCGLWQRNAGLIKSGHLTAVEGVDGGYRLSNQMLAAITITVARQAEQAKEN
jgi:DNA-binding IscR family transcriptional regulator